jgi:hypothetical protein
MIVACAQVVTPDLYRMQIRMIAEYVMAEMRIKIVTETVSALPSQITVVYV